MNQSSLGVIAVVFSIMGFGLLLVGCDEKKAQAPTARITESDPRWVERLPGVTTSTAVRPGECGQFDGVGWHPIACPSAKTTH